MVDLSITEIPPRTTRVLKRYTQPLPHTLVSPDYQKLARELSDVLEEITNEKERAASVKRELGARLSALESRRSELASKIRRGTETRETPVTLYADLEAGKVYAIREDTGEILSEREMTDEEQQAELFPAGPEPAGPAPPPS